MPILLPEGRQSFTDALGLPLIGGKLYTYAAGTNTPLATFADASGTVPNTNPVVLDARGEATIFWLGTYKVVLRDIFGNLIWTVDNVTTIDPLVAIFAAYQAELLGTGGAPLIGFEQAGAGATAQSVQDALRRTISIYDFIPKAMWAATRTTNPPTISGDIIQAALNEAAVRQSSFVHMHGAQLKVSSGFVIDPAVVGIVGDGAWLDFSPMTEGDAITFVNSEDNINRRALLTGARSALRDIRLSGPGVASNVRGMVIDDPKMPLPGVPNVTLASVVSHDFKTDIYLGNGAFCFNWYGGAIGQFIPGTPTAPAIDVPMAENAGESFNFNGLQIFGRDFLFRQRNGNAGSIFTGCRFDYNGVTGALGMGLIEAGVVDLVSCHLETNTDGQHWWRVMEQNAALRMIGGKLVVADDLETYSPFYSDVAATQGGVSLSGVAITSGSGATWTTRLIAGDGRALVRDTNWTFLGQFPTIAAGANLLANGGFESENWSGEWAVSDMLKVFRTNAVARTGAYSMEIDGTIGINQQAVFRYPAEPGQSVRGELYAQTTGLTGSGGTLFVTAKFIDRGQNILSSAANLITLTDIATWQKVNLRALSGAPKGTAQVELAISLFGVTSGAPKAYIDDIIINLA